MRCENKKKEKKVRCKLMVSMHDSLPKSVVLVLLHTVILGETLEYDINFLQQGV